jgi:inward rectifier potassium channel
MKFESKAAKKIRKHNDTVPGNSGRVTLSAGEDGDVRMRGVKPRPELPDLGFGSKAAEQTARLVNRDGSFNIERKGLPFLRSFSVYQTLLTMSWWKFNALILIAYVIVNLVFATIYMFVGMDNILGMDGRSLGAKFLEAFFFSTQTFTTVGYGRMSPTGFMANSVSAIESMFGLLAFALATGVLFGRFSRPYARIIFSDNAIVAPYRDITGFMFRVANERSNQMIDVSVEVNLSRLEIVNGAKVRKFHELSLERQSVGFFHLSWTIVHPIDVASPLWGVTKEALDASDAEFLIILKGFDDIFSQTVHTRTSYKHNEVMYDVVFSKIIRIGPSGKATIDLDQIHDVYPVPVSSDNVAVSSVRADMDKIETEPPEQVGIAADSHED